MTEKKPILILLGGGVDSALVLDMAVHLEGVERVDCMHIAYGQAAAWAERVACRALCNHYGVKLHVASLPHLRGSSITGSSDVVDPALPHFVPHRNAVLVTYAAAWAWACGIHIIGGGWQSLGTNCPDVQPGFLSHLWDTLLASDPDFVLWSPLVFYSKAMTLQECRSAGVPIELTWSCFGEGPVPCGKCPGCMRLIEAWKEIENEA